MLDCILFLIFCCIGVAVALKQALTPEFKAYQVQVLANCRSLASSLIEKGYKIVTGEFYVNYFQQKHILLVCVCFEFVLN